MKRRKEATTPQQPRKTAAAVQDARATAKIMRHDKSNENLSPQQAQAGEIRRAPGKWEGKSVAEIVKNLPRQQKRVYQLLAKGGRYSAGEIVVALGGYLCHANSVIRDLRAKGIAIGDEWVNGKDARYKRFFLRKEVGDE